MERLRSPFDVASLCCWRVSADQVRMIILVVSGALPLRVTCQVETISEPQPVLTSADILSRKRSIETKLSRDHLLFAASAHDRGGGASSESFSVMFISLSKVVALLQEK